MSFSDFIQYLQTPTGIVQVLTILVSILTSLFADWIPGFKGMSMRVKRLIFLIGCPALPVVATVVVGAVTVEKIFFALAVGFAAYWSTQNLNTVDIWAKPEWAVRDYKEIV